MDERYFEVLYGPVRLGFLDSHAHRFYRTLGVGLRRRLKIDRELDAERPWTG